MRIGIDVRASQLVHGQRGIGKYTRDLVDGLVRLAPENEYVLLAFPDLPLPDWLEPLPPRCQVVPVPTRCLAENTWIHRVRRAWRLYYLDRQREHMHDLERAAKREGLDVLHLPCVIERSFYSDGHFHCRVVKTLYDLIPLAMADELYNRWGHIDKYVYRQQTDSYRRADVVAAISESARQDAMKHLGLSPEKVRAVPCVVSEEFVPISDVVRLQACREKYGIRHPFFLFCSGDGVNKNRERVIAAFGQFAPRHPEPYHLVFVGPREFGDTDRLKAIAFDLGLDREQLLITGFVPDDDLVTLFSGAAALVSPSLYEGFGLPAAQAMQAGTPVIGADCSSHPEVIGDAGLLVDPYSVDAIAEAMLCLARDADLRAHLSARGRERVRRFRWQNQAQAMLQIYRGGPDV